MTVVIFDGMNQAHMASITSHLDFGTVFNMLRMFRTTASKFKGADFVYVFDGGISQERLELHPHYKHTDDEGNRPRRMEPQEWQLFTTHISIFQSYLHMLGIPDIRVKGEEADDIIGLLTQMYQDQNQKVIIVSNDSDFRQLLDFRVNIYNPRKKEFYTLDDFDKQYNGITTEQFISVKAIMGDEGSDNIPGIYGIGVKTAVKIIKVANSLDALPLQVFERGGKIIAKINNPENIELVKRNYLLVKIPRRPANQAQMEFVEEGLPICEDPDFKQFFDSMNKVGFNNIVKNRAKWEELFEIEETGGGETGLWDYL
jgi:5'-3' exonuclease